ncbi:hypothetical protein RAS2_09690 [Phycisphaerae bacterium RAS2]|nr:hypothetical protein RAS2_09690 [Phycisphaerae bacterium RAS2]
MPPTIELSVQKHSCVARYPARQLLEQCRKAVNSEAASVISNRWESKK